MKSVELTSILKKKIKKYFLSHLNGPFCGIDARADEFGVSNSTLKRLFKKHYGQTALSFFKTLQMRHAQKLIQSRRFTVSDVAFKLGFSSV